MTDRHDAQAFKARIDDVLARFTALEADQLLAIDPELRPVADRVTAAVAEGKRLRAAFCYWGWRAAGQPDSDALVRAAASMELVHAAAVVHDDLIDDSARRHGRPTTHVALRAALHRRPRAAGAARALAMLVGDLLMSLAGQLFTTSGLPAAYLGRARPLWARLARDLIAGECLEVLRTGTMGDTAASLQVVRYKTAKYTVEQPLLIGGALAGAGERLSAGYSAFGLPLGEAFQLRDDLLGMFGDPARTGKDEGDDLRARRPTALLAETWRAADAAERGQLRALLGRRDLDASGVARVRELMDRLGAPAAVERMIADRVAEATGVLAGLNIPASAARALTGLAHAATARGH
ncbi:polyprenyl synthetase family protein [Streptomyces marincola]|uniref:polyprenyl synthetase family protein n=1 Tax=Streptomyces marincola TaxID=2878388 RepID=UPI001CF49B29|nr:polyprenyl synthetase family protein [Streptomyces marincola]UCM90400.1 polyprenyl synthetase family protein [Streptomyces marincola]